MNTPTSTRRRNSRGRCPDGSGNPIDVHVGSRLKLRRELFDLSQQALAEYMGMTFQQVQKYEKGHNRISASRLWDFSQILGVDIHYFFQDMPQRILNQSPRHFCTIPKEKRLPLSTPPELTSEAQEFLHDYLKIAHLPVAQHLRTLLHTLARPHQTAIDKTFS